MQNRTAEIAAELYHSLALLGARSDLLSVVGSWGDSLSDDQVLATIRAWNEATADELKACIENYETPSHRRVRTRDAGRKTA